MDEFQLDFNIMEELILKLVSLYDLLFISLDRVNGFSWFMDCCKNFTKCPLTQGFQDNEILHFYGRLFWRWLNVRCRFGSLFQEERTLFGSFIKDNLLLWANKVLIQAHHIPTKSECTFGMFLVLVVWLVV